MVPTSASHFNVPVLFLSEIIVPGKTDTILIICHWGLTIHTDVDFKSLINRVKKIQTTYRVFYVVAVRRILVLLYEFDLFKKLGICCPLVVLLRNDKK